MGDEDGLRKMLSTKGVRLVSARLGRALRDRCNGGVFPQDCAA